jgi:hypothetical protein
MLDAALSYAARGWKVFPCRPGGKAPAFPNAHPEGDPGFGRCTGQCGRLGHGFHDATTDPAVLREWWRATPDRNVAIATGAPGPDVLDVDTGPAGSGWAALNRVKRAGLLTGASAMVTTRSGGLHLYFAGTSQPCGRLPRHWLDFKGAGGYVLAPPSFVQADDKRAGRYQLVEQRDADGRLDWQTVRRLLDPLRPVSSRPPRGLDACRLAAWVAELPEGNRNNGLFWAACRIAEEGGDPEILIAASGLPEDEARRTVASADRRVAR